MEYITAEQFLKQDKEVQKVLLEWWERNISQCDLIYNIKFKEIRVLIYNEMFNSDLKKKLIVGSSNIPLLTEGQLRKFIEDKFTNATIDINYEEGTNKGYQIRFGIYEFYAEEFELAKEITVVCKNLLQAYWQVALEASKESVK